MSSGQIAGERVPGVGSSTASHQHSCLALVDDEHVHAVREVVAIRP